MKYADGQQVRLGDRVRLGKDDGGVVVASIDTDEYDPEHRRDQWSYLKKGVVIRFPEWGPIHYEEPERGLELIGRAPPASRRSASTS